MNDHLLEFALGPGSLHYLLVDRVHGDDAEDEDGSGLSDAVSSVLSLQVTLRILQRKTKV